MKLGEFREATKHIPDDADLLVDAEGDLRFWDTSIRFILPPVLEHPYAVTLDTGQVWNEELDLDARVDAEIGYYGGC